MAELHVFGQVVGAGGFSLPSLFCKWSIEAGSNFRLLQGLSKGQTQCDQPNDDEMAVWAHPVDVHYSTKGIDGWPRLCVEVWGIDTFGRYEIAGYGCCVLPAASGHHQLKCLTWRPIGSAGQRVSSAAPPGPTARRPPATRARTPSHTRASTHARARAAAFFLGGTPTLKHSNVVSAPSDRFRLHTETCGEVLLELSVITKDFQRCSPAPIPINTTALPRTPPGRAPLDQRASRLRRYGVAT